MWILKKMYDFWWKKYGLEKTDRLKLRFFTEIAHFAWFGKPCFFKIKFVFFLYLQLSASIKGKLCLYVYISDIRQILGYRTPVFIQRFPWRLHITITYNLQHLQLICWRCHSNSVKTGGLLSICSDVKTRKRRNVIRIDTIRNNCIVFAPSKFFEILVKILHSGEFWVFIRLFKGEFLWHALLFYINHNSWQQV